MVLARPGRRARPLRARGYAERGEVFLDAGIEHVAMEKAACLRSASTRSPGCKTIIAADRATRPGGGLRAEPAAPIDPETDPFLEGHEDQHAARGLRRARRRRRPDTPGWRVRVVPNLYPALTPDGAEPAGRRQPRPLRRAPGVGAHEVIVNAPDPVTSLADLEPEQVAAAVDVWRERMRAHAGRAPTCT